MIKLSVYLPQPQPLEFEVSSTLVGTVIERFAQERHKLHMQALMQPQPFVFSDAVPARPLAPLELPEQLFCEILLLLT